MAGEEARIRACGILRIEWDTGEWAVSGDFGFGLLERLSTDGEEEGGEAEEQNRAFEAH